MPSISAQRIRCKRRSATYPTSRFVRGLKAPATGRASLRDGLALVFPERDTRRNPFLGGIGRKLLPRLHPALLRDRAQHRREKIGHRPDIAQRRALIHRAM